MTCELRREEDEKRWNYPVDLGCRVWTGCVPSLAGFFIDHECQDAGEANREEVRGIGNDPLGMQRMGLCTVSGSQSTYSKLTFGF